MTMNVREWTREHFMANQSDCKQLLENADALQEIPCLNSSSLDYFKEGQLVKFRGMIQDIFNPEYYYENYEVKDTNTGASSIRSGMFVDITQCSSQEQLLINSPSNKHSERQPFFVISVPGLNDWANRKSPLIDISTAVKNVNKRTHETTEEELMDCSEPTKKKEKTADSCDSAMENSKTNQSTSAIVSMEHILNFPIPNQDGKACIVKVYENEETHKLNDVIDIIGFLSLDPAQCVSDNGDESMDDMEVQTHNPPVSMVPRLHAIKVVPLKENIICRDPVIMSKAELIRSDLQMFLSKLLFDDTLAADYLICHLISSIYMRKDFLCLGSFPINITKFPLKKCKDFSKELYGVLTQLIPKSHYVELTLENLNDMSFTPKKDYQCNRLTSGVLQLSNNTHLVIDETHLTLGLVTPCGRKNYDTLNKLVQYQKISYDFQFYTVDYETDIPVLILSETKSFIPCPTQVPLKVDDETVNVYPQVLEAAKQYLKDETRLNNIRQYLNILRHGNFEFNDQMTKIIQEDFVKMRQVNKSFTGDNLHTLMVFARLMALSYGKNTLTSDIWKKTFEFEVERIGRIPKRN